MRDRFGGTVEELGPVDVRDVVAWITAIPFLAWPQQTPVNGDLRPAMVTDPEWYGFAEQTTPLLDAARAYVPNCLPTNPMLSVVMPGHDIPTHADRQSAAWRCRVHVPLTSNPFAARHYRDGSHRLTPGTVYRVNTERPHGVTNAGLMPRIHFMVDMLA